jgi:NAD/NADP transhydrogenase beta subunit
VFLKLLQKTHVVSFLKLQQRLKMQKFSSKLNLKSLINIKLIVFLKALQTHTFLSDNKAQKYSSKLN